MGEISGQVKELTCGAISNITTRWRPTQSLEERRVRWPSCTGSKAINGVLMDRKDIFIFKKNIYKKIPQKTLEAKNNISFFPWPESESTRCMIWPRSFGTQEMSWLLEPSQVLMVSLCVQACRSSVQRRYDKECERGIYFELYYVASGWRSIRFSDPVEAVEELLQNLQVHFKGQRAAKELNEGISCHPLTSLTVFITT